MIYLFITLISLLSMHISYANFSSTAAKDLKQPVNFAGKLTTHQGQEFAVDNISIHGKYKEIDMIDKPVNHAEAVLNSEEKRQEIKLTENPNDKFTKTGIDLDKTKEITVPYPNVVWVYQKKEGQQKLEFLEVDVISKSNTKTSYLLEIRTPIYCDAVDPAGPQEKSVPLSAVKTLTIDGYTYRDTSKDKNKKCRPDDCPPCVAEKNKE